MKVLLFAITLTLVPGLTLLGASMAIPELAQYLGVEAQHIPTLKSFLFGGSTVIILELALFSFLLSLLVWLHNDRTKNKNIK